MIDSPPQPPTFLNQKKLLDKQNLKVLLIMEVPSF